MLAKLTHNKYMAWVNDQRKNIKYFNVSKIHRLIRTFNNIVLNSFPSIYSHLINQVTPRGGCILGQLARKPW